MLRCVFLQRRSVHSSAPSQRIYNSILETIGNTPIVRVNNFAVPNECEIYVKCEYFNPMSSVKDRLAFAAIMDARKSGQLLPGGTVVEATSGNTGIALAMVCAQLGHPLVITMADSFSVERRRVMRMLGAKVVLTPAALRGSGMVNKAKELAEKHGYFWTRQFENESNPAFHAQTTGAEIVSDFAQRRFDYFVTGYGTGGTFQGASRTIKAARPEVKIVVTEPANAALVSSGKPQERHAADGTPSKTHPAWAPHPIQGWTPDFISKILDDGLNSNLCDRVMTISGEQSIKGSHDLAKLEGIFTGVSGGATFASALEVAKQAPKGSVILAMLPDTAERYLSTPLFTSFLPEMNAEEKELSNSTPYGQYPKEEAK